MVMIEQIASSISTVLIFVLIISWFCGVYFSLSEIAIAAKKIVTLLEQIVKEKRK